MREFGVLYSAEHECHEDGWHFEEDDETEYISYRECDIFGNHADGNDWDFRDSEERQELVTALETEGFKVVYNSGDEEDVLFRVARAKS